MSSRDVFRTILTLLAAGVLWCAADVVTRAAKEPVSVADTVWSTEGKLKAKASKFGSIKYLASIRVAFGSDNGVGLPASGPYDVELVDLDPDPEIPADLDMQGGYAQDEKGKIQVTVDEEPLETYAADSLRALFASVGFFPEAVTAQVLKSSAKAKVSYSSKKGESIKVSYKGKAAVTADFGLESYVYKVSLSYKGVGGKLNGIPR
jgi:hypothetical protein